MAYTRRGKNMYVYNFPGPKKTTVLKGAILRIIFLMLDLFSSKYSDSLCGNFEFVHCFKEKKLDSYENAQIDKLRKNGF